MAFWPLTNSDFPSDPTFHQFHDLYIELDLHRIMSGFHGSFAMVVASQQGTLTLPDTWFRPPFWTCLCSNCWDQIPRTCHVFTRLFTLNTRWYFLDFAFSFKWIKKVLNCLFRELLVPIMPGQVCFNLKTKLAKRHINSGHCFSLGKENILHFSRRITVAWCHQTMTSHFFLRTAPFKHHCKIRKCFCLYSALYNSVVYSKRYASSFRTFWSPTHIIQFLSRATIFRLCSRSHPGSW